MKNIENSNVSFKFNDNYQNNGVTNIIPKRKRKPLSAVISHGILNLINSEKEKEKENPEFYRTFYNSNNISKENIHKTDKISLNTINNEMPYNLITPKKNLITNVKNSILKRNLEIQKSMTAFNMKKNVINIHYANRNNNNNEINNINAENILKSFTDRKKNRIISIEPIQKLDLVNNKIDMNNKRKMSDLGNYKFETINYINSIGRDLSTDKRGARNKNGSELEIKNLKTEIKKRNNITLDNNLKSKLNTQKKIEPKNHIFEIKVNIDKNNTELKNKNNEINNKR